MSSTPPPASHTLLALGAVYVVWGSTYLAIRFGVETLPPFLMAGVRFLAAGALMLAWARRRGEAWPTGPQWHSAAVAGCLFFLGGNGLLTWAETRVPSGLAALIVAAVPLWTVLLDWMRPRGLRPSALTVAGLVLGFVGVAVLVDPRAGDAARVDTLGAAALMVATVSWAIGSIWARESPARLPPVTGAGANMVTGGLALVAAGIVAGEASRFDAAGVSTRSLLGLLYLITFGSLLGFTAYVWLLRHASAAVATSYAYVNPVVAIGLGWAFAGEAVTARVGVAAVVVVAGVVLITVGPLLQQAAGRRRGRLATPRADRELPS